MAINVTTSKQQITASVAEDKISANVSAGFGAVGPSGVVNVTAPITNSGTTTSANVGLSIGSGLSVSSGSLIVTPNTYATLVDGKIPAGQLPSYVDDVVEVATFGSLPSPGEQGKIYLVTQTNKVYRWTGFVWLEIVASPGSTDSIAEGSVNLYYTNVRAAAAAPVQSVAGRTGTVVLAAGDIASGTLSASRLPIAAAGTLGAVRIGSGISIDPATGVISASSGYTLPTATNSVLGGVKVGSGVTITDGVISVSTNYAAASHGHEPADIVNTGSEIAFEGGSWPTGETLVDNLGVVYSAILGKASLSHAHSVGDISFAATDRLLGRSSAGAGTGQEIVCTAAGRAILDDADAAAQRTTLGLGTAATSNTGDFAAASHNHAASAINSGTLDIARLPVGTSSTTVAAGNDARLNRMHGYPASFVFG